MNIKKIIEEIEGDERMSYKKATISENAPLALIQLEMETRLKELKRFEKLIEELKEAIKNGHNYEQINSSIYFKESEINKLFYSDD